MKKYVIILFFVFVGGGIFFFINKDKIVELKSFTKKHEENKIDKVDGVQDERSEISNDLFGKYYGIASEIVGSMTLEEKVGQLFLVRFDSCKAVNQIENFFPGGYILFAKDFQYQTKDSIRDNLNNYQGLSKYPLIFAVDEEGGIVNRVSKFTNFRSSPFLSPRNVFNNGGYDLLQQIEREKAELLLSLGINLNLAPVVDVSINSSDFIYSRSFGYNAKDTAEYAKRMVGYANEAGISSCLKHFPGYGNNQDTHYGSAYDMRDYNSFLNNDFLPFKAGIEALVPTILISHNIVFCMDDEYPASLSSKVIGELRNTLKFTGIVMTDDLAMGAVSSYVSNNSAAVLAIKAGNDLLITSSFETMYQEVLNAVINGEIKEEVIDVAVRRIIAWKYVYKLF